MPMIWDKLFGCCLEALLVIYKETGKNDVLYTTLDSQYTMWGILMNSYECIKLLWGKVENFKYFLLTIGVKMH